MLMLRACQRGQGHREASGKNCRYNCCFFHISSAAITASRINYEKSKPRFQRICVPLENTCSRSRSYLHPRPSCRSKSSPVEIVRVRRWKICGAPGDNRRAGCRRLVGHGLDPTSAMTGDGGHVALGVAGRRAACPLICLGKRVRNWHPSDNNSRVNKAGFEKKEPQT
jgi:hypothetical protein